MANNAHIEQCNSRVLDEYQILIWILFYFYPTLPHTPIPGRLLAFLSKGV